MVWRLKTCCGNALAIFDDLDDAVFKFDGCSVDDISQGIDRILNSIREQNSWATRLNNVPMHGGNNMIIKLFHAVWLICVKA